MKRMKAAPSPPMVHFVLVLTLLIAFPCTANAEGEPAITLSDGAVREAGILRVGMECAYAPYNWTQSDDSNGAVPIAGSNEYANGYDVMMAKRLADALGCELEIYKIKWDGLIMAVNSNKIDAVVAGMSTTENRKLSVDFYRRLLQSGYRLPGARRRRIRLRGQPGGFARRFRDGAAQYHLVRHD